MTEREMLIVKHELDGYTVKSATEDLYVVFGDYLLEAFNKWKPTYKLTFKGNKIAFSSHASNTLSKRKFLSEVFVHYLDSQDEMTNLYHEIKAIVYNAPHETYVRDLDHQLVFKYEKSGIFNEFSLKIQNVTFIEECGDSFEEAHKYFFKELKKVLCISEEEFTEGYDDLIGYLNREVK